MDAISVCVVAPTASAVLECRSAASMASQAIMGTGQSVRFCAQQVASVQPTHTPGCFPLDSLLILPQSPNHLMVTCLLNASLQMSVTVTWAALEMNRESEARIRNHLADYAKR